MLIWFGVVRTAGADNGSAALLCVLRPDFGHRICHSEYHRVLGHGGNHLGSEHLRSGHAEEYIRTLDSIGQRACHVLAVGDLGHLLLCRIQTLIALADDAEALNHRDVLDAEEHQELGNGDSSRAAAVDDHLDLIHLAAGQAAGVEQSRTAADSRAVLVIVEYRNVADLLESALDLKAARSRDVLEVDAANEPEVS